MSYELKALARNCKELIRIEKDAKEGWYSVHFKQRGAFSYPNKWLVQAKDELEILKYIHGANNNGDDTQKL